MDLDRERRAAALFQSLLSLPTAQRPAALAAACGEDPAMQAMVTSMLALDGHLVDVPVRAPGAVIGGLTLLERLGAGGAAEVWAARRGEERLALKVLHADTPALRARLLAEGAAQRRLRHRNILPVLDVIDLGGAPGLLMPLVEGPSLDSLLRRYRPTSAEAHALLLGILDGVAAAHSQGVIHRDLKPGNVLLSEADGAVVPLVADFGLVKDPLRPPMTADGMILGTPAYAAPEQLCDAAAVDARADLFSLGVVLFELLAARLPFVGQTIEDIRAAHQGPVDFAGVEAADRAVLQALLSADPADRPASCAEVRAALRPGREALRGGILRAVRQPPMTRKEAAAAAWLADFRKGL